MKKKTSILTIRLHIYRSQNSNMTQMKMLVLFAALFISSLSCNKTEVDQKENAAEKNSLNTNKMPGQQNINNSVETINLKSTKLTEEIDDQLDEEIVDLNNETIHVLASRGGGGGRGVKSSIRIARDESK